MEGPRVSAFAIYQHETKQQNVVPKKKKNVTLKLSQKHKLLKKKRKLLNSERDLVLHSNTKTTSHNGLLKEDSQTLLKKGKLPSKKAKKVCTIIKNVTLETPNKTPNKTTLDNRMKQHVGPPLQTVLKDLSKIQNSKDRAFKLFEWLIAPISRDDFFRDIWEKKPALIRRHNSSYYNGLFSTSEFDRILREDRVEFGVNLDVTSYTNGKRATHNPPGRALPLIVWDYYRNGCSLRLLNPQTFSSTVWNVLSILQELFGTMVGANTYLTPAGTQGFAPHYDDIEAFVVQLEGKKHWRVYNPRNNAEWLPQFSSANFTDQDIGKPVLETILEAGDLLYFPRGFIHQGDCLPDAHSLHITISSYQRNCWGDLLAKVLPVALRVASEEDLEFRKGLPLDYLEFMGVQNADEDDPRRGPFIQKVQALVKKLSVYAPIDAAVDQKAKEFLHDCLPPVLMPAEKSHSVVGAPVAWENGQVKDNTMQLEKGTKIRLLRSGIIRLCSEGEDCMLYYSTDNSRIYHKEEPKCMEIELEHVSAVEYLIHSYPKYVNVEDLPCTSFEDQLSVANILFEKGLLTTKERLVPS
ncbi:ribosomal oxygenase 1 [Bombina bombina]|uniref:ribosomal oxygenase 1 n=1 Tax=Bombina bombina TaxID=8345 RepID=UPI00235AE915|nr:ribosomal oxygenase 1 [Bombina bombina]